MTDDDIRRLASAVAGKINIGVDHAQHARDHAWIQARRRAERDWQELRRKVIASAAIWALPLVIGFVAAALWGKIVQVLAAAVSAGG